MRKEVIEIQVKGTGEGVKQVNEINKSVKKVESSAKQASKETDGLSKSAIDGAKNFQFMGVSINGVSKTLKLLKVSLIATGIGAIVVAVGALAAAFLSTQAGVDKLNSVLVPAKEVLETIWGITQKLGASLFKIISGDVKEGFNDIKETVKGVGEELKNAVERGNELYDLQIRIRENAVNDGLVLSRLNRLRSEQLAIAEDTTIKENERREAFNKAIAAEEAMFKLRKRANDDLIAQAQKKTIANDTDAEARKELNDLIADGENLEAGFLNAKTLLVKKLNAVKAEAPDTPQKERKRVESIQTNATTELEIIQNTEDAKTGIITDGLLIRNARIKALEAKALQDKIVNIQSEENARQGQLQMVSDNLNNLQNIFTAFGKKSKAIAIASIVTDQVRSISQIISNTAIANAKAVAATPLTLGQPFVTLNTISAGIGIASSVASAAKSIADLRSNKQSPSTGSSLRGVSGGGSIQAQSPQFNIVGSSETNQLAGAIGGQIQKPIKAFVVSKDVSTAQEMDRNVVNSASFG